MPSPYIHPRLSVDALSSWSYGFEEDVRLWSELGVSTAGLSWRKMDPDRDQKIAELRRLGISSATVTARQFNLSDPATWEATRAGIATAVETALATGGRSVYIVSGPSDGRPWGALLEDFATAVEPSVEAAADRGVRLALEPSINTGVSFIHSIRDAIDVADRTGISIVVDFGNCWMERDLEKVMLDAAPFIGLVQVCDVIIGTIDKPSPGGRVPPGDGDLQLARLLEAVLETGYDGPFDLEVLGPVVEAEGYETSLSRAITAASALLDQVCTAAG